MLGRPGTRATSPTRRPASWNCFARWRFGDRRRRITPWARPIWIGPLPGEDAPFRLLVRLKNSRKMKTWTFTAWRCPSHFPRRPCLWPGSLSPSPPDPYASGRQDLTGLACLTIDGERTRDFDDALSLEAAPEGWRLGIHIADVTSAVLPGEILDLEACQRGTSIYLPERRLPMLPEEISEETLSLVASQPRPVLSFLVTLSGDAEVKDWTICPGFIKVRRRLTYHEVDQLLPQDQEAGRPGRLEPAPQRTPPGPGRV